jgi:hypothetical protein
MTRKTVPIEIDDENFVVSLVSPGKSPEELVEALLDHPIGSPKLEKLARGKKNIVELILSRTRYHTCSRLMPFKRFVLEPGQTTTANRLSSCGVFPTPSSCAGLTSSRCDDRPVAGETKTKEFENVTT